MERTVYAGTTRATYNFGGPSSYSTTPFREKCRSSTKNIDKDFPLRGFLICETCGHRLTSCWSTSGTGRKYPYYLCHFHGCSEKGRSTARNKVEHQFEELLQRVQPGQRTIDLAKKMFRDAWEWRLKNAAEEAKRLRTKSKQIDRDIAALLDRIVRTQNVATVAPYEQRISELQTEKAICDEKATQTSTPVHSFDEMFELSLKFLANPYEIWKKGDFAMKRIVLRLIFAQPLEYSRKEGVRTAETTFPFKVLRFLSTTDLKMVHPTRFELVASAFGGQRSIQLS